MKAVRVPIADVTVNQRNAMFALMQRYYEGLRRIDFESDLSSKDRVIFLLDRGKIVGFTTLLDLPEGVFSGDTIVDRPYWGSRKLQRAFTRHLILRKARAPWRDVHWFLVSKGYRTYLLMANNFFEHWPRPERATPERAQRLMDAVYGRLFPDRYDGASGILRGTCRLKPGVVPPGEGARAGYFARRNPGWERGDELACVARFTLHNALFYLAKTGRNTWQRRFSSRAARPASVAAS